jgi:hypothetical protein
VNGKKKNRFVAVEDYKESEELETEDIYDGDQREEMFLDDEITAAEDDFMLGRELSGKNVKRFGRSKHEDSVSAELAEDDYEDD